MTASPRSTPSPTEPPEETRPPTPTRRLDLSAAQLLGGALAAMTAAYLGSRVGVAGTVLGAALASLVAGVAGSVYTASLRSTGARVRTVFTSGAPDAPVATTPEPAPVDEPGPAAMGSPAGRPRLRVRRVVLATLAVFALAGAGLTTVELATGSSVTGGGGTTVAHVAEGDWSGSRSTDGGSDPDDDGTGDDSTGDDGTGDDATPSPEPSASATAEPEATPSAEPSTTAETSPSAEPSEDASPSTEPSETATASPSATPSAADGSANRSKQGQAAATG